MNSALERAVALMRDFNAPWGLAGGWALDVFVGRQSRPHADIDIAILRTDQQLLRSRVSGRVEKVLAHQLAEWSSNEVLELPVHEVHVTWDDGYQLEFLFNEQDPTTHEWVFRRDARIRRALHLVFRSDRVAPYVAPEVVLLYKAKASTPKDDGDFGTALPLLQAEQRSWLARALDITLPGHRWTTILAQEA
jgi:hypothetical protein